MNSHLLSGSRERFGGPLRQVATFAVIGAVSTLAYIVLYAWLRNAMPATTANATALLVTALGNTAANRRLTFDVQGRDGLARDHAAGLLALAIALAITTCSLALLSAIVPHHSRASEIAVLVAANAAATLARFLLLRVAIEQRRNANSGIPAGRNLSTVERIHR